VFKKILVPVDGSSTSEAGLKTAIGMVQDSGGTLVILHVVDEHVLIQTTDYVGGNYYDEMVDSLKDAGRQVLAKACAQAQKAGVPFKSVSVETIEGGVAALILDQCRKVRADAIVMGTHGRRGLSRMVLGSDAEGVVRGASVPVVLVKAKERAKS
jgi:nucleotide-binding universal stress UspA family protein